jgi:hypothetical protein
MGPTNCFYTHGGYILPLNSFAINKSTSKPSSNFVDFMAEIAPKPRAQPESRPSKVREQLAIGQMASFAFRA